MLTNRPNIVVSAKPNKWAKATPRAAEKHIAQQAIARIGRPAK